MNPDALRPLPWQRAAWTQVREAQARGQLHHAWLLSGPQGVGKHRFVRAWAATLLCERSGQGEGACGQCSSCQMLASGGHPDAHLLSRDGHLGLAATDTLQADDGLTFWQPKSSSARKEVVIDAARSLMEKLALAANRGGHRVVVVTPAEAVNVNTANALLKTIEEPPARTTLIFIAEFSQALPQTVRSRCQQLRMAVPDAAASLAWLQRQRPEITAAHLQKAGGAPLKVLHWLEQGRFEQLERWCSLFEQVLQRKANPLTAAAELLREKSEAGEVLRHWQTLLLAQLRAGEWSARHEAFRALLVESLRALEHTNANALLALESLLLRWRQLAA